MPVHEYVLSTFSGLTNFSPSQIKLFSRYYSQPNTLARKLVPPLSVDEFNKVTKNERPISFVIVRHPYERLLSAYRDKFENKKKYYHNKYGEFMIRNYRRRGIRRFGKKFYRRETKSNIPPHRRATQRRVGDPTPTFWEFVRTIIDLQILDDHWRPASILCSLCRVSIGIFQSENYLYTIVPVTWFHLVFVAFPCQFLILD